MSTHTFSFAVTILLAISFFAAGCTPANEVSANLGDEGKQIELLQGQTLLVKLESNITTGYSWEVTQAPGPVLQQQGEAEYQQPDTGKTPLVGAGGTQIFRFKASAPGQVTLNMAYRRPWETGVAPAKTFTLKVTVK